MSSLELTDGEGRTLAVSVTIATKDRALELETISLPSLAGQDTRDFEVIIWDASTDTRSEQAVRRFSAQHPDLSIRWFRAPRVGSCAQRNDAVPAARGEIIFFIDDDCEVSPDGVSAVARGFRQNLMAGGGALPLTDAPPGARTLWTTLRLKYYDPIFGLRPWRCQPRMQASGAWLDSHAEAGEVDHLIGCDMAFRRSICLKYSFNEAMQRLAPYALWEDTEFSHRVWQNGHRLFVFGEGSVIHHRADGNRTSTSVTDHAQSVYNRYVVWRYAIFPFQRSSVFAYLWSVVGESLYKVLQCLKHPWQRRDYFLGAMQGYRAILQDAVPRRKTHERQDGISC